MSGCCGGETMATSAMREAIAAEARSWIGTRFVNNGTVKGAGVDCGGLLVMVYAAVGLDGMKTFYGSLGPHPHDWFLHRKNPDIYATHIGGYADPVDMPQQGDFALFTTGRAIAHSAICVENLRDTLLYSRWVQVLQAVHEVGWNDQFARRLYGFYRVKGIE